MSSTTPKPPTTAATTTTSRPLPTTTKNPPRPQQQQQQQQLPHISPYPPIAHHPFHLYPPQTLRPPAHPLNPNPNAANSNANPRGGTAGHNVNASNLTAQQAQLQQQQHGMPYPVASSGRGFIHRSLRPPDPSVGGYNPRAAVGISYRPPHPAHVVTQPHLDPGLAHLHQLPNRNHQYSYPVHVVRQAPAGSPRARQHPVMSTGVGPGAGRGTPVTGGQVKVKAAPSASPVSDSNGYKNSRDRSREDNVVTVRGRKVRIVDGASLYALCRSWLRNGQPEDSQPHNGDSVKSLPRPLPLAEVESHFPSTKEDKEVEDEQDEVSVDHLSPEDLLKRHIKRAKKVRARLREERLKRIERYKTRLALLLPPQVEQFQNDTAAGDRVINSC